MKENSYFYQFLEPVSKELAFLARELENSIFTGPRVMLTHSRVFVEHILRKVIKIEGLPEDSYFSLLDRIQLLDDNGYLTEEITATLHFVRKMGNKAAHESRRFRYSEALLVWEAVYKIVKWFVEVYGDLSIEVPEYQDPSIKNLQDYDIQELLMKIESLEQKLDLVFDQKPDQNGEKTTVIDNEQFSAEPGLTPIRTIRYKGQKIDIPFFLRDAFLLPQRFPKSERYLIRLGAQQQARIMSELPNNLEGLSKHVKRYGERNEEVFFEELKLFVQEEIERRKISLEYPGELFIFFKSRFIILTENLASIPLNEEYFTGIPNLLKQLHEDQIEKIGQLPKELVILAKYDHVGITTVEKLFNQIQKLQKSTNDLLSYKSQ